MLHPGPHEFWDKEEIRFKFMDYLAIWSKNPAAYIKKGFIAKTPPQLQKKQSRMKR